jgi:pilus assembly protein CpaC
MFLAQYALAQSSIELLVGEQKSVEARNISKVFVGDASIVDVKAVKTNELLVTGLAAGVTTVSVVSTSGDKDSFTVKVLAQDPRKVANDIKQLIGDIEGLVVRVVGDRVIIDGEVFKENEMERVNNVVKLYPAVTNFITYNKSYNLMKRLVQIQFSLYEIITADNKSIGLRLHDILDKSQLSFGLTQTTASTTTKTATSADPCGPTCDAKSGSTTNNQSFSIAVATDLLDLTADNSRSRKLDEHAVITRSGEKVQYLNGGEVPIVHITANMIEVEYKEWGFKITTIPELDKINNCVLDFDVESSEPDWGHTVQGYPSFVSKKAKGKVNMKEGEHVMIFGFSKKTYSKTIQGIPGFSKIPLLGYFFGVKGFEREDKEGVLVVTPSIFQPVGNPTDNPRIQGVVDKYEKDDSPL